MKILVTGINGQLGYDVMKVLENSNHEGIGIGRKEMDLTDSKQIKNCITNVNPDAIIHCAAYTKVDLAEDNEKLCRQVNAYSVRDIAQMAKLLDIPMIYISTDYVFDGLNYKEYTEEDICNPQTVYGKTKLEGELYVQQILEKYYIVRISWVFGENGKNFIDTMLKLAKERDEINVIADQIGSPTYTKDLAPLLIDMIETDKYGIYHVTNDGFCSWYEFAKEIFKIAKVNIVVNPISSDQYPAKATRPLNSKMSKNKLIDNNFKMLRHWKEALKEYF